MKSFVRTTLLAALAGYSAVALATHNPDPSEAIEYDGSLSTIVPVEGSIGWDNPIDGYDWYCIDVTSGQEVEILVERTSGDILPNVGALQGLAGPGGTAGSLPGFAGTDNDFQADVNFVFTPDFSGPVTLWVSTYFLEEGGTYEIQITSGASARRNCDAEPTVPVPVAGPVGLAILAALLGLVALVRIRKQAI